MIPLDRVQIHDSGDSRPIAQPTTSVAPLAAGRDGPTFLPKLNQVVKELVWRPT
jgi:hypothetical protein